MRTTPAILTGAREISLTIPVAPDMEIVATAQAAAVGEFIAMPHDKIDEVKLALVEAYINAFEHAHARDDRVHLTFRVDRDEDAPKRLEGGCLLYRIPLHRPGRVGPASHAVRP